MEGCRSSKHKLKSGRTQGRWQESVTLGFTPHSLQNPNRHAHSARLTCSVAMKVLLSRSQTLTVPSMLQVASSSPPFGEYATPMTQLLWPCKVGAGRKEDGGWVGQGTHRYPAPSLRLFHSLAMHSAPSTIQRFTPTLSVPPTLRAANTDMRALL